MKLELTYKIILWLVALLLAEDIFASYYDFIWNLSEQGIEPAYGLWLQSLLINCGAILLLKFSRTRPFTFLIVIVMGIDDFIFIAQTASLNPFAWIKYRNYAWAIGIVLEMANVVISLFGLLIAWRLHWRKSHTA